MGKVNRFVGDDGDVVFPEGTLDDVESDSDGAGAGGEADRPDPEENPADDGGRSDS